MHGPAVVSWLLVAVCGATGAYRLARCLGRVPPGARHTAGVEAAMGLGMAVMALPLGTPRVPAPVFAALFGGTAVWALYGLRRSGTHCLHHALEASAMVYMALAMRSAAPGGHAAHAGHTAGAGPVGSVGVPLLTAVLLAYFAAYALRAGTRLVAVPGRCGADRRGGGGGGCAPGASDACGLNLAMGSFAMLVTL
ncbi:DUF5134 domain-containing protein [Streptomyces phytohabitans]|uniref:DUF5134 domain-containing protein n=1 Tax=Streptomyces phytohabitans TaxID=1150371 RepID=UPI00345BCC93